MNEKQTNVDNQNNVSEQNVFEEDTLTEDQIIKEGLKFNKQSDLKYVFMIFAIAIMIFIPPIFRVVFYDPTKEIVEVEVVYLTLNCRKGVYRESRLFNTKITSNYKDGSIQTATIEYTWDDLKDGEIIPEAETFLAIDTAGFTSEKITNGYKFNLDYSDKALLQVPELEDYKHAAPAQMNVYREKGFICESESVTEKVEMTRDELNKQNK